MNLQKDIEFIMLKPEGVRFARIIFNDIYDMGLKAVATKGPYMLSREKAQVQYAEKMDSEIYRTLIEQMTSGPIISSVLIGDDAIAKVVDNAGYWDPNKAKNGTWRERFGNKKEPNKNVIHRSDTASSVRREVQLHFDKAELVGKLPTVAIQYLLGI